MKNIFYIILFFISSVLQAGTYYISKTGSDSNSGSYSSPWATWNYGFNRLVAGDTLFIRAGEYFVTGVPGYGEWNGVYVNNRDGTSSNRIVVSNYGSETVVLNCETMYYTGSITTRGINLVNCDYWTLIGLTVEHVPEIGKCAAGFETQDCDYITYQRCVARHNEGPGFALNGTSDYSYFINCDSWGNVDGCDAGGFGDGFIASHYGSAGEYHTYFINCRAWWNSDDGFDTFVSNSGNSGGYIEYNGCWAWKNGRDSGNGAGFKWGGSIALTESGVQRVITGCLSFYNRAIGIDQSEAVYVGVLYNNTVWANGSQGFYNDVNTLSYFRNNISFGNVGSNYYEDFGGTSQITKDHNSWQSGYSASADDFISMDTTGISGYRSTDGSLPDLDFLKLKKGSDLIDRGVTSVGYGITISSYYGTAPDLGYFESGAAEEPEPEPEPEPTGDNFVKLNGAFVKRGSDFVKH